MSNKIHDDTSSQFLVMCVDETHIKIIAPVDDYD